MLRDQSKLQRLAAILVCMQSVLAVESTLACSFCSPDYGPTLWKRIDEAHTAVFAELIQLPESGAKNPVSRYRITANLKGDKNVTGTDQLEVPLDVRSPPGSVHLFLADRDSMHWQNPRGVSRPMREFLMQASKLPKIDNDSSLEEQTQRLAFALPHLISRDKQVANSVYGEFAVAPDSAVKQLRPILNPHKLRAWIDQEPVSPKHRRLMFTLLRICGDAGDIPFVEAALDDRLNRNESFELDAIIATYLALAGSDGLDEIDRRLLSSNDVSLTICAAVANALRFHVDNESVIGKERVVASCRRLVRDARTADYVLRDLARWEDWASLDDVLQLQQQAGEKRWLRTAIDDYLKKCPLPKARMAPTGSREP